jgi:CBS domain containing-hemolysin-like protein
MGIFLAVLAIIVCVCLVVVAAMHPLRPQYSLAELTRRAKKSESYTLELDRYELHASLVTLLRSMRALLLVLLVVLLIGAFGWLLGVVLALIVAVIYPAIARLKSITKVGRSLYEKIEPKLLDIAAKFERLFHILREPGVRIHETPSRLHSRDDLAELIERSKDVVGEHERTLLVAALAFPEKTVQSIMTPRSVIDFIKKGEFLGPLVLDELHALGHSRLPVIAEDLDHVVGILHLRDMLSLDVRTSATAEKVMEKKVYYIREDDALEHALAAFIRTRHHLFIVINKNRETVGLLTLEDVMEALIGRKIVDEDDVHADLRAVAEREGRANNRADGHVDL